MLATVVSALRACDYTDPEIAQFMGASPDSLTLTVNGYATLTADVRDASNRDVRVIIPAILIVIFLSILPGIIGWLRERARPPVAEVTPTQP